MEKDECRVQLAKRQGALDVWVGWSVLQWSGILLGRNNSTYLWLVAGIFWQSVNVWTTPNTTTSKCWDIKAPGSSCWFISLELYVSWSTLLCTSLWTTRWLGRTSLRYSVYNNWLFQRIPFSPLMSTGSMDEVASRALTVYAIKTTSSFRAIIWKTR